mgnify:CR=1 FL=1
MELVARLLALILVIVTILLIIIVAELGYMIYHKQDNEDNLKSMFGYDRHRHHDREDFNPERNYPKPKDSVFRDEELPIYYAAGGTELPNDVEHIRDNYYSKNVKPY